ncbi:MAG: anaerobic ribonucleoside-triphosphate reductase activating protein [Candidatus Saganbacteria bacterium]|nr:anaerobic ribonucleoside-triphosphate reductase activating protein [Candidatus Saganbacteria bacterium]
MNDFDIRGFLETSFLDWDGKIVSVLFIPGCNFRCPFCHNSILITRPEKMKKIKIEDIEAFIQERKDFIDGIVITGGEPTLNTWLPELCKRFKKLGLLVKLDTNGTNPKMLLELINSKLVDYVAMDYKGPLDERYDLSSGVKADPAKIKESIDVIINAEVDHEFRLTVVPTLHNKESIIEMLKAIPKAKRVVLQQFVNKETLDKSFETIKPYEADELKVFAEAGKVYVPNITLRGV